MPTAQDIGEQIDEWVENTPWVKRDASLDLQFVGERLPSGRALDIGANNTFTTHLYAYLNRSSRLIACDSTPPLMGTSILRLFREEPERRDLLIREAAVKTGIERRVKDKRVSHEKAHPVYGYVKATSPNIPVASSSFNAILAMKVLDYLDDPVSFLAEAQRILHPRRGKLFVSIKNPYHLGPGKMMMSLMSGAGQVTSQENIFAECLERLLLEAASQGFEMSRLARSPFTTPPAQDSEIHCELKSTWEQCEALYPDRVGERGIRGLLPDEAPEMLYFEFSRKDPTKIFVPEPDVWRSFVDGASVEKRTDSFAESMRIEYLPTPSRKAVPQREASR